MCSLPVGVMYLRYTHFKVKIQISQNLFHRYEYMYFEKRDYRLCDDGTLLQCVNWSPKFCNNFILCAFLLEWPSGRALDSISLSSEFDFHCGTVLSF